MNTMLVVANRTLGDGGLLAELQDRVAGDECSTHVLVPASPQSGGWSHDPFLDRKRARQRLDAALEDFTALGCSITGEVGDPRPIDAVMDVLRERTFDEIIVSTLPPGASRWLRMDVVSRIERGVAIPVTHVVGQETLVNA